MPSPNQSPQSHFVPMGQLKKGKSAKPVDKIIRFSPPDTDPTPSKGTAQKHFTADAIGDYASILVIRPGYPTTQVAKMKAYALNDDPYTALAQWMKLSGHTFDRKQPTSRTISPREYVTSKHDPNTVLERIRLFNSKAGRTARPWANHIVFATNIKNQNEKDLELTTAIREMLEYSFSPVHFYDIHQSNDYFYEQLSLRSMQKHLSAWQLMATFLDLLDWPLTDTHTHAEFAEPINRAITTDLRELPCGTHLEERDEDNAQEARKREEARVAAQSGTPGSAAGGRVRLRNPQA